MGTYTLYLGNQFAGEGGQTVISNYEIMRDQMRGEFVKYHRGIPYPHRAAASP